MDFNALLINVAPFLILVLFMYFAIIRPQQKKNKQQQALLSSLKKGDKVVTIGGLHGTVKSVEPATITILVGTKATELTFDKQAIRARK